MKKIVAVLLLFVLLSSPLFCASPSAISPSDMTDQEIVEELINIQIQQENTISQLENTSEERRQELIQRNFELEQRKNELKEMQRQRDLFGNLIDEQATYFKSLERGITLWRATTVVFSVSTLVLVIILIADGK